ncbi:MAG: ABC transporter permease [Syntrophomonadaceae bacterium]|jgi:ABC-type transport system involved in multi-copper enzyme maturation permease subunit
MTMPSKDIILPVNPGLLWKEWQQNRLYFLAAFLVMTYDTIMKPLGYWIKGMLGSAAGAYTMIGALDQISNVLSAAAYHNTMEQIGPFIVLLLGVTILIQERSGSLNYLISTPVSRKEIIVAKSCTGSAAIAGIMAVNALFLIITGLMWPVDYSTVLVIKWTVLTTAIFIAIFNLGLMVASFTGNWFSAIVLSMLLANLPSMLRNLLINSTTMEIFNLSPAFIHRVNMMAHYLTIPAYITRDSEYMRNAPLATQLYPAYPLETMILVLLTALLLLLAIRIFQNNPLENNGQMLMSNRAAHIAVIILALLLGWGTALSRAESAIAGFLITMVLGSIIAYLAIVLLQTLVYYIRRGR